CVSITCICLLLLAPTSPRTYSLSLHDALPILQRDRDRVLGRADRQLELAGIVGRHQLAIDADHDPVAVRAKRLVAEEAAAADTDRDLVARVDRKVVGDREPAACAERHSVGAAAGRSVL